LDEQISFCFAPQIHVKLLMLPVDRQFLHFKMWMSYISLRLGVEPENWVEPVSQFESRYRRVMGPVKALRELAEVAGIRWFHGISRCLQFYRPSPA